MSSQDAESGMGTFFDSSSSLALAATPTPTTPVPADAVATRARNPRQRLEVPVFGAADVALAVSLGAGRLELNAAGSYAAGGTTPTIQELHSARSAISSSPHHQNSGGDQQDVPLRVMIRPRGPPQEGVGDESDFVYSDAEFDDMREVIVRFTQSGLLKAASGDGFVFGVLRKGEDGRKRRVEVDVARNAELVNLARPFAAVFHRAFDDVVGETDVAEKEEEEEEEEETEVRRVLEDVRSCGFGGILTSGGPGNALDRDNAAMLGRIIRLAAIAGRENAVEIIVGGGVRSENIRALMSSLVGVEPAAERGGDGDATGVLGGVWFHSSCLLDRNGVRSFDGEEVQGLVKALAERDTDG
ncbi:CutC family protein [Apodospora peruviana]|uniref:Copper homeostasis protein cutC homolog n=1 Tax=Apodospora peruviana TaxID=516989 RepID=A0AAE0IIG5_9PEZI|nr:CutC family protein [Apodospora peruviana]